MGELAVGVLDRVGQIGVRADPADATTQSMLRDALGAGLPLTPGTWHRAGERDLLWLGPDEWLVAGGDPDSASALADELERLPSATPVTAVDLSAARIVVDLAGAGVRDVLARGCSLDLHPRAFGPERCAQTMLAQAQVVLQRRDAGDVLAVRLFVRRSFVPYVSAWLADAAAAR
jgi:sarcosine oxidase subunit gamma